MFYIDKLNKKLFYNFINYSCHADSKCDYYIPMPAVIVKHGQLRYFYSIIYLHNHQENLDAVELELYDGLELFSREMLA